MLCGCPLCSPELPEIESAVLQCPHCKDQVIIYHFEWEAIVCQNPKCRKEVNRDDWKVISVD